MEWGTEFLSNENEASVKEWACCDIDCEILHTSGGVGGNYFVSEITLFCCLDVNKWKKY